MRKSNDMLPATMIPKEPIHEFPVPVTFDPVGNWVRVVFQTIRQSRPRQTLREQTLDFIAVWLTMNPFEASEFTIDNAILQ